MINKLTPKQESKIPVYFDKWLNMPSKPMDKALAFECVESIYKIMDEKKPVIIVAQSPLQASLMAFICKKEKGLASIDWSQLELQLWSQLGNQLELQLGSQLWSQLELQLRSQLGSQLESQLELQ